MPSITQPTDLKKPQPAYWTDWLLWGIVASIIGLVAWWGTLHWTTIPTQEVSLEFEDAHELRVGSPVRMAGLDIGYINDLKVNPDHIKVSLKTYPGQPHIPRGSHFTVSFSGLVGAKSVEITPPKTLGNLDAEYHVDNPIRLKETLEYQINIANALKDGADNMADFFGKKKPIEELKFNIQSNDSLLLAANQHLGNAASLIQQKETQIHQGLHNVTKAVEGVKGRTIQANQWVSSNQTPRQLQELLMGAYNTQASLLSILYDERITQAAYSVGQHQQGLATTTAALTSSSLPDKLVALSSQTQHLSQAMLTLSDSTSAHGWLKGMQRIHHGITWLNTNVQHWNKSL